MCFSRIAINRTKILRLCSRHHPYCTFNIPLYFLLMFSGDWCIIVDDHWIPCFCCGWWIFVSASKKYGVGKTGGSNLILSTYWMKLLLCSCKSICIVFSLDLELSWLMLGRVSIGNNIPQFWNGTELRTTPTLRFNVEIWSRVVSNKERTFLAEQTLIKSSMKELSHFKISVNIQNNVLWQATIHIHHIWNDTWVNMLHTLFFYKNVEASFV